ncbi:MAG: hypothetical protein J5798_00775 [Spirochaetaceae bacterium]|nr:hypothetical protein [Spirochaetaceae bacterium]
MIDKNQEKHSAIYNFNVKSLKRGANRGYCRICGKIADLTDDHIPPKSCGNKGRTSFTFGNKTIIMQNGFHCRTICTNCNNVLLGSDLDKEFKKFYDQAKEYKRMHSSIIFAPINKIDVDAKKILRCILAHFLATNACHSEKTVEETLQTPLDQNIVYERYRQFVLSKTQSIENTDVYYWYYPFSNIVINPYFGCMTNAFTPMKKNLIGTLIKFFPIALFILNRDRSDGIPRGNLFDCNSKAIALNFEHFLPKEYLERPLENEAFVLNSNAVVNGNREL